MNMNKHAQKYCLEICSYISCSAVRYSLRKVVQHWIHLMEKTAIQELYQKLWNTNNEKNKVKAFFSNFKLACEPCENLPPSIRLL